VFLFAGSALEGGVIALQDSGRFETDFVTERVFLFLLYQGFFYSINFLNRKPIPLVSSGAWGSIIQKSSSGYQENEEA